MNRYRTDIALCGFILLAIVLVFGQLSTYGFIHFDDLEYVVKNKMVGAGLTWEGVRWAFTTTFHWQWQPVTWLSHMSDVQLFGIKPGMHHLVSLFFHAANSLLLFFFFKRVTGAPIRSATVAILFAVHPLHVEPVAMVAYRKDLLSTFFLFGSLNVYVGYVRKGGGLRYGIIFMLFILGLMSKAVIVSLPILLLLLDFWPLGRFGFNDGRRIETGRGRHVAGGPNGGVSISRIVFEKVILIVPMAVLAVVAILARNPDKSLFRLPTWHHVHNGLVSYVLYIGKALWPSNLAVIYPAPGRYSLGQVVVSGLVLLFITGAVMFLRKRKPWLAVGWFWYLLTLLPVIGILGYMGPHTIADRYAYIPITGLLIMVVWGVADLLQIRRIGRSLAPVLAGGVVLLVMAASWLQVGYWKNSVFLFNHAVRVTDDNYKSFNNLALAYAAQGNDRLAEEMFLKALETRPDSVSIHLNIGRLYRRKELKMAAETQFREVLAVAPNNAEAHSNLGQILRDRGDLEAALGHFRKAVENKPRDVSMRYELGSLLISMDKASEAVTHLSLVVEFAPDLAEAHSALGCALSLIGINEAAVEQFQKALQINPDLSEAREGLEHLKVQKVSSSTNGR